MMHATAYVSQAAEQMFVQRVWMYKKNGIPSTSNWVPSTTLLMGPSTSDCVPSASNWNSSTSNQGPSTSKPYEQLEQAQAGTCRGSDWGGRGAYHSHKLHRIQ